MNETIREWLQKAEGDFATARRELHAEPSANFDATCFHAQQCVEKLMKALLIQLGATVPRTHDLAYLGRLLAESPPGWSWPVEQLRFLSRAAIACRYPGESATQEVAGQALELAQGMRESLLSRIEGPE